jgi:hypothetical protein
VAARAARDAPDAPPPDPPRTGFVPRWRAVAAAIAAFALQYYLSGGSPMRPCGQQEHSRLPLLTQRTAHRLALVCAAAGVC